jgi:hypothetical protein
VAKMFFVGGMLMMIYMCMMYVFHHTM